MNLSLEDRLNDIQKRVTDEQDEPKKETTHSLLEKYIDSKRINIYSRNWNKLEIKLKIKKMNEFIESFDNTISDENKKKIIKLLTTLVKTNKLNKSSDVNYDKNECKILDIKYLKYIDEKECYRWKDCDITI